ncbi:MAG TPA: hypothetical protein VGK26_01605 [Thermoanaerobaculia bacterium]|jgi:hypothetical protein
MVTPPPPDRSMGAVLVRAFLFFSAGFVGVFVLAYAVLGIWRGGGASANGSVLGDAAIAAYVFLVTAIPAAFGFAIVVSPWPAFRDQALRRVAWLSAAGGVATYLAQATGVAGWLYWIPIPGAAGPIGAAFRVLLPGAAVGLLALAAASLLRLRPPPSSAGD